VRIAAAASGVVLAVLAAASAVDQAYFANAVAIAWRIPGDGGPVVIGESVEHDVSIPSDHRPIARYVGFWRVAEHGPTRAMPALDAVVRARMSIPPGPARGLMVLTRARWEITADGRTLGPDDRLGPGNHALAIHWHGTLDRNTRFELAYDDGDPVPRSALHLPGDRGEGDWPSSRWSMWITAVLLALVLGALAARVAMAETPTLARERWLTVATLLVMLVGVGLRAYDLEIEPHPLENFDEYFNVWNGWSLVEDGSSRGWSAWPTAYRPADVETDAIRFWGTPMTVVSPYFENLPLMHVLVGIACHLGGADDWHDARVAHGRWIPVLLGALTIWLLVRVGRRLVPSGPGPWLGALLWAATPTLVIQTRVIKEELVVVPLALATLLFFLRWRDDGRRDRDLWLAATCAGLAILAKIPGVMLVPGLIMLVVATAGARQGARAAVVATLAGGVPLAALLAAFGPAAFLAASGAQTSGRGVHFNLYSRFLDVFQVNGWFMGRGWLLFLWVAAVAALYEWRPKQRAIIAVPAALYFVAIGVGAGNNTLGWYLLPIVAYLCIPAGAFLGALYERPDLMRGVLFGVLFVMYTLNFAHPISWLTDTRTAGWMRASVLVAVTVLTVPYCLAQVWPGARPLARGTFVASFAATLTFAASVVLRWEELWPEYHNMDRTLFFP
jgi:4-amino-4-deoxy-L-arabinose transferase-like glycosyltransferase